MKLKSWRQPGLFGRAVTVPRSDILQNTEVLSLADELRREQAIAEAIRTDPFKYLPRALRPSTIASVIHAQRELWAKLWCDRDTMPLLRRRRQQPTNPEQMELL